MPPRAKKPPSLSVTLAAGTVVEVQHESERAFLESLRDRYLKDNDFTLVTDLQDLDRLLIFELVQFRMSRLLASGKHPDGTVVLDEIPHRKSLNDAATAILKIKESLQLDRAAREKEAGETTAQRWASLQQRARRFVTYRNDQVRMAIAIVNELHSLVGTYRRSNEVERAKLDLSPEAILDWVEEVAWPRMQEIDKSYREHDQSLWIRKQAG